MREIIFLIMMAILCSSCSSCCKKKYSIEKVDDQRELTYDDFELVGEEDQDLKPTTTKEYNLKVKIIRRTYLI
jgi:hypothetical protein